MNKSDARRMPDEADPGRAERIRAEIGRLLQQRAGLARSEKSAAIEEKTRSVAHQIRSPLAAIQAVCSTLLLETEDPDQRRRLELINAQVEKIATALSDAVHSRDEPREVARPVDLSETIGPLVDLVCYQIPDTIRLNVELGPDLVCRAPERGLTRSLYQLLRHAVESLTGRSDGQVQLRCTRHGATLRIEVCDNGPGLPAPLHERGLRAFAAQGSERALELNAIARLVRGLGGEIHFANLATGGASVVLHLPVDSPQGEAAGR